MKNNPTAREVIDFYINQYDGELTGTPANRIFIAFILTSTG